MAWDGSGFLDSIKRAREALPVIAENRMGVAAESLLGDAQGAADFPFDTGSLQGSGAIDAPAWNGDELALTLHFGGDSAGMPNDPVNYAEPVHEGFDLVAWGHDTGRHIEGRPYLAEPFASAGPDRWQEGARGALDDLQREWEGT